MYRKCYDNITVTICQFKPQKACILPLCDKWSAYKSLSHASILHRIKNGKIEYTILFCLRLKVNNYKHYSFDAFNKIDDTTFGGAIKKQRIEKHMTIKNLAKAIGVSKETYMRMEQNKYALHNADKLRKLCDILDLDTQKICSPYQLFLLNNPGEQIKSYRLEHNLTQFELANMFFIHKKTLSKWENNKSQMPYDKWRIFIKLINT